MTRQSHWLRGATAVVASAAAIAIAATDAASPQPARADDCPTGGTVRFGVEPYDTAARLVPIYEKIGKLISDKVGCKVEVFVATGYNAEIEAMRNGKLELAEFGPLGYVLAHQVAKAEAVAAFGAADGKPVTYWASVITYPSSGIKTVADIRGHSFAFSDAASTSGHFSLGPRMIGGSAGKLSLLHFWTTRSVSATTSTTIPETTRMPRRGRCTCGPATRRVSPPIFWRSSTSIATPPPTAP